jgi:flagellar hook-associated protein 3 FlgL
MRVTSQMMLSRYKRDVNDAYASMNKAMAHAYNYRSFDLPSDNPLAAAQTFQIHTQMSQNSDYAQNISNVKGALDSGDQILMNVVSQLTNASGKITAAVTDSTNASGRSTYANQLVYIRDDIIAQLNSKYGDNYLFGGSGADSVPFELVKSTADDSDPATDKLYYRGVNVDTGLTKSEETEAAGYQSVLDDPASTDDQKSTAQTNLDTLTAAGSDRLKNLASDTVYVDIGLGMSQNSDGSVNTQSVFNRAMPGLSYLGFGTDSNGTPQNICSLLSKIAGVLQGSSGETIMIAAEKDKIAAYEASFDVSQDTCISAQTSLGNRISFLNSTADYISGQSLTLSEQDDSVEYVSPYDAIEEYYNQMYCYNASLKVGSQILQQSLMDYLK